MLRPRRSLLFMPGSNPRALEKARALPADGLIFDLEDAVAPEAKDAARGMVAAALAAGGYGGRELVLRVNGLDTPWGHADLAAAATMPVDAVLLPKVENADRVRLAAALLDTLGAPPALALWCMVETPLGILNARRDRGGEPAACRTGRRHLGSDQRSARAAHAPTAWRCCRRSAWPCSRPGPMVWRRSTASISISPTTRGSRSPAGRAASSASTARP